MSFNGKNTIETISAKFKSGEVSPSEILDEAFSRVDACEKELNALNTEARVQASEACEKWVYDENFPFSGVPYIQKDNICTRGIETNCSSRILEGFVPPYSATADSRFADAGFNLIAKGNMDEFGMGSSNEHSAWGPSKNPFDTSRTPGGSSGGCACAVAAGYVPIAFGTDTGGSVRLPASFCGLAGLRPTYGLVSRWGLIAYASSLDQIGPIANTVRDCAIGMSVIQGTDGYDSTAIDNESDFLKDIEAGIEDLKIGVLDAGLADWVDPRVKSVFEENVSWFNANAAETKEIKIKSFDQILAAYYVIAPSEASSNLARYDGIRYGPCVEIAPRDSFGDDEQAGGLLDFYRMNRAKGFGDEVTRRILLGTYTLSAGFYDAYYRKAQKVRANVARELKEIWKEVDLIISPTAPTPPFKLGSRLQDPMSMYQSDLFTLFQPITGCPAISINGGWTNMNDDCESKLSAGKAVDCDGSPVKKLPIGLQITGKPLGENVLLKAARAFEREHN